MDDADLDRFAAATTAALFSLARFRIDGTAPLNQRDKDAIDAVVKRIAVDPQEPLSVSAFNSSI